MKDNIYLLILKKLYDNLDDPDDEEENYNWFDNVAVLYDTLGKKEVESSISYLSKYNLIWTDGTKSKHQNLKITSSGTRFISFMEKWGPRFSMNQNNWSPDLYDFNDFGYVISYSHSSYHGTIEINTSHGSKKLNLVHPKCGLTWRYPNEWTLCEYEEEICFDKMTFSLLVKFIYMIIEDIAEKNSDIKLSKKLNSIKINKINLDNYSDFNRHPIWKLLGFKTDDKFKVLDIVKDCTYIVEDTGIYSMKYKLIPSLLEIEFDPDRYLRRYIENIEMDISIEIKDIWHIISRNYFRKNELAYHIENGIINKELFLDAFIMHREENESLDDNYENNPGFNMISEIVARMIGVLEYSNDFSETPVRKRKNVGVIGEIDKLDSIDLDELVEALGGKSIYNLDDKIDLVLVGNGVGEEVKSFIERGVEVRYLNNIF